jgi:hypothetical protein
MGGIETDGGKDIAERERKEPDSAAAGKAVLRSTAAFPSSMALILLLCFSFPSPSHAPFLPFASSQTSTLAHDHLPLLLVAGELGAEEVSHLTATSAASSLALLRFLPSYQNRALC